MGIQKIEPKGKGSGNMKHSGSNVEERAKMDQRICGVKNIHRYDKEGNYIGGSQILKKGRQRNVWNCPAWDVCLDKDNCAVAMGDNQVCGVDEPKLLEYLNEIDPLPEDD